MSVLLARLCFCKVLLLIEIGGNRIDEFRLRRDSNGSRMEGFIVGGTEVSILECPHSVFLVMPPVRAYCGAAVLSARVLLTAGHCVAPVPLAEGVDGARIPIMTAWAGHENILKARYKILVIGSQVQEEYSEDPPRHDIALVFLRSGLPLGTRVKRLLISPSFPPVSRATLAGWGRVNDFPPTRTLMLQRLNQNLLQWKQCKKYTKLRGECFCTGDAQASEFASRGDSGSSLTTAGHQALGVVSHRLAAVPGVTVFTNVSHYYRWITRAARALCRLEAFFDASLKYFAVG